MVIVNHSKEASILFYSVAKNIPIVLCSSVLVSVDPYELKQPVRVFKAKTTFVHVCTV